MIENIKETRLNNGLAVLTDQMPGVRSVTLAFFFRTGSRNEPDALNGITHFIEHAVFKGTATRSALDIAIEQDRLGGTLEAPRASWKYYPLEKLFGARTTKSVMNNWRGAKTIVRRNLDRSLYLLAR